MCVTKARPVPMPGDNGSIAGRQMLRISLSQDQRVIDGVEAAKFVRFIAETLAFPDLFA